MTAKGNVLAEFDDMIRALRDKSLALSFPDRDKIADAILLLQAREQMAKRERRAKIMEELRAEGIIQ